MPRYVHAGKLLLDSDYLLGLIRKILRLRTFWLNESKKNVGLRK